MKTIDGLKSEINQLAKEYEDFAKGKDFDNKHVVKLKKKTGDRIAFIRDMIRYLEFAPTEASLNEQVAKLEKPIATITKKIKEMQALKVIPEAIAEYKSKNQYKKLTNQVKALKYILS